MAKKKKKEEYDELAESRVKVIALFVCLSLIVCFLFVYVFLIMDTDKQSKELKESINNLTITTLNDEIILKDTYPMTEDGGMSTDPYTFTLLNTGDSDIKYVIKLEPDQDKINNCESLYNKERCDILDSSEIRYSLMRGDWVRQTNLLDKDHNNLDIGIISPGKENEIEYKLKIWIDSEADRDYSNAFFFGKLVVETK